MVNHTIDTVRLNPELQFPSDVTYKFIFWEHVSKNIPSILPHLDDCDIIAFETPASFGEIPTQESIDQVYDVFGYMNEVTMGTAPDEYPRVLIERMKSNPDSCDGDKGLAAVTEYLASTGKTIVPVDSAVIVGGIDGSHDYETVTGSLNGMIQSAIARESLVLKQLSQLGYDAAQTISTPRIGVLYGSGHSTISTAARQLGASVEQVFAQKPYQLEGIDKPETHMLHLFDRLVRFGVYEDTSSIPDIDKTIAAIAANLAAADDGSYETFLRHLKKVHSKAAELASAQISEMNTESPGMPVVAEKSKKLAIRGLLRTRRRSA